MSYAPISVMKSFGLVVAFLLVTNTAIGAPPERLWRAFVKHDDAGGSRSAWKYYKQLDASDKLASTVGMVSATSSRQDSSGPFEVFRRMIMIYQRSSDSSIKPVLGLLRASDTPAEWKTYLFLSGVALQLWGGEDARSLRDVAVEIGLSPSNKPDMRRAATRYATRTTMTQIVALAVRNAAELGDYTGTFEKWISQLDGKKAKDIKEAKQHVKCVQMLLAGVPTLLREEKPDSSLIAYDLCLILGNANLIDPTQYEKTLRAIVVSETDKIVLRARAAACLNILHSSTVERATLDSLSRQVTEKATKQVLENTKHRGMSWIKLLRQIKTVKTSTSRPS